MNKEHINETIIKAITDEEIDVFLPEPKHERDPRHCSPDIRKRWIAAIKKEVINLIENDTFKKGQIQPGDKPIPTMIVFKAKVTSRGFLDKLKAGIVARGDRMDRGDEDTSSGCLSGKTVKCFLVDAAHHQRKVKQLDFIGAFLYQRNMPNTSGN